MSDSYTIAEDTTLTVAAASGVLANDSDVESDPLTAVLVSGPAHGVLTLNADGGLRYTPSANYNGADSFTYKANDGTVDGNVTTVAIGITPVNDAPVAVNDGYTLNEDTTLTVAAANGVLANDTDVENDPLTAALVSGPVHGTLTLNADGGLSYTPDANYNGADSFTYRTSDGALTSATATVALTIAAVNDAPVINGARAGQTTTDQTSLRPLAAMTIADPDSGATETVTLVLTDSASKATDANGTLSGAGLTKTGTGTYTLAAGAPAAVTAALEAVTFTPTAHQAAPGQTVTTGLYVAVSDGMLTAANGTTSIAATAAAVTPDDPPPAITVTAPALAYRNHAPLKLFAGTVITDPVREARDSLSITLRDGNGDPTDANGRLSGAGLTKTGTGTYTFAATTPAALTRELAGLSFRPAETRGGSMGGQVATHFTLAATRGGVTTVFNAFNTIVAGDNEDQDRHGRVSGGPMTVTGSVGGYTAALLGEGNHTVALGGGYNTVVAGDGDNTVIGAWGGFTAVTLGGGRQQVTLGGGSNTIVAGNGGTIVKGSPGGHTSVLLGHGDNVVEIGGTHDIVKLGNGANQVSGTEGMAFIVTGNGNDTIVTGGASNIINAGGGKNTIVTDAGSDTFVLPKAGQGFDSITGFSTLNGDVLDLRTALAATKWNGGSATLGTYLKVTSGGGDTTLSVTSTGRGVGTAIATLKGAGDLSLSELMSHHSLKF